MDNWSTDKVGLTRPQRQRLYGAAFALIWIVFMLFSWSRSELSWSANASVVPNPAPGTVTPGTMESHWGALRYLTIIRNEVGFDGVPVNAGATVDWQWAPLPLTVTILATIFVTFVCWTGWRWSVGRERLVGQCDECGYDLTGLCSKRCPECGAQVTPARRAAVPPSVHSVARASGRGKSA